MEQSPAVPLLRSVTTRKLAAWVATVCLILPAAWLCATTIWPPLASHSADGRHEREAQIRFDRVSIVNIVVSYASDHEGDVPAFDSKSLPSWWDEYAMGRSLTRGIRYRLDANYVGRDGEQRLLAAGPAAIRVAPCGH